MPYIGCGSLAPLVAVNLASVRGQRKPTPICSPAFLPPRWGQFSQRGLCRLLYDLHAVLQEQPDPGYDVPVLWLGHPRQRLDSRPPDEGVLVLQVRRQDRDGVPVAHVGNLCQGLQRCAPHAEVALLLQARRHEHGDVPVAPVHHLGQRDHGCPPHSAVVVAQAGGHRCDGARIAPGGNPRQGQGCCAPDEVLAVLQARRHGDDRVLIIQVGDLGEGLHRFIPQVCVVARHALHDRCDRTLITLVRHLEQGLPDGPPDIDVLVPEPGHGRGDGRPVAPPRHARVGPQRGAPHQRAAVLQALGHLFHRASAPWGPHGCEVTQRLLAGFQVRSGQGLARRLQGHHQRQSKGLRCLTSSSCADLQVIQHFRVEDQPLARGGQGQHCRDLPLQVQNTGRLLDI
mmetsp:Transcript_16268/g.49129  ORF Transcript_16268/g.49129 Transcript_16268/m.49129 type:complete len:399 (+) Transcript_16268:311-1507(+)